MSVNVIKDSKYLDISDKLIMRMLCNHQSYRKDIDITRRQLIKDITDIEDMIAAAICPGRSVSLQCGGKTNMIQDPVYDSVVRLQAGRYRERIQQLQKRLIGIEKEEAAFDRVYTAFQKTFWLLPQEFEIVNRLFFTAVKTTTWDAVALELAISKRKITQSRQLICKLVRYMYDSDYTTEELGKLTEGELYALVDDSRDEQLLRCIDKS